MTSKPGKTEYVFGILFLAVIALALLLASLIVAIPVAAIAIAAFFAYRHYQFERIKGVRHIPETIQAQSEWLEPAEFYERIKANKLLQMREEDSGLYSCYPLSEMFLRITAQLYADESLYAPPHKPETTDQITIGRYYDKLEQWQRKVSDNTTLDIFFSTMFAAYMELREYFPRYALQPLPTETTSKLTTPLILTDDRKAGEATVGMFFNTDVKNHKLFEVFREQVEENDKKAQRIAFSTHFLQTPFRQFAKVQIPITLREETRFSGMWICAPPDKGKTTLLHTLVAENLQTDACVILMDTKGELIEPFIQHPGLAQRRIIVGPDNPVGLNPLDVPKTDIIKVVDTLEYLFASLADYKLSGVQSMVFKATLRLLITTVENPTLKDFQELLAPKGEQKYAKQIATLDPDMQNFFRNEYNNSPSIKARREEVLQRLRNLLEHDLMRSMLMAPKTTFNISDAMDNGALVIIDASRGKLGNNGAEFFGRFFIAQVLAAAQQRSFRTDKNKRPVYFYIDEAYTIIAKDERITDVLHECRSQRIALTVAHQEMSQMSEKVQSALRNCAIRFASPEDEARAFSSILRLEIQTLKTLRQGQFGAYIRDLSKEGIIINVEKTDLDTFEPAKITYSTASLLPPSAPPITPDPAPEPIKQTVAPTEPPTSVDDLDSDSGTPWPKT